MLKSIPCRKDAVLLIYGVFSERLLLLHAPFQNNIYIYTCINHTKQYELINYYHIMWGRDATIPFLYFNNVDLNNIYQTLYIRKYIYILYVCIGLCNIIYAVTLYCLPYKPCYIYYKSILWSTRTYYVISLPTCTTLQHVWYTFPAYIVTVISYKHNNQIYSPRSCVPFK